MAKAALSVTTLHPDSKKKLYGYLDELHAIKQRLAADIARDRELRQAITDEYFPAAKEGTNTMNLEFGKQLKVTVPISRSVSEDQLAAVRKLATDTKDEALLGAIDRVFVYKPSVSVSEWKETDKDVRIKLADVVTEKVGLPAVEIATPKR